MQDLSSMILHILTLKDHTDFGTISGEVFPDNSCKILQSPSQKFVQDFSGMISPDIVPKSVMILHTKSCKSIEVFNPRSCLCDVCKIFQDHGSSCFKILQEFFLGIICRFSLYIIVCIDYSQSLYCELHFDYLPYFVVTR